MLLCFMDLAVTHSYQINYVKLIYIEGPDLGQVRHNPKFDVTHTIFVTS